LRGSKIRLLASYALIILALVESLLKGKGNNFKFKF
jgi:hypothetical protein